MKKTEPKIIINMVMFANGQPAFVEFSSTLDRKMRIAKAARFCNMSGYTMEELMRYKDTAI